MREEIIDTKAAVTHTEQYIFDTHMNSEVRVERCIIRHFNLYNQSRFWVRTCRAGQDATKKKKKMLSSGKLWSIV